MNRSRVFSLVKNLLLLVILQFIIAILFLLITPGWWEPRFANWLQVPETKLHSDAIIVLGGDTVRRVLTGVELVQEGIAPRLAITGNNPQEPIPSKREAEQARDFATSHDVPLSAITLLQTTSTFEDSQQIVQYMLSNGLRRVTVVSDWFHARRALCSIKQALGTQNAEIQFWPAQIKFGPQNWWRSEDGLTSVFTEAVKEIYYIFQHHIPMWDCWPGDVNLLFLLELWIFSGLMSLGTVLGLRQWASRHLVDIPNERSSHMIPTPRGGGLGIVIMTLLPLGIWLLTIRDLPAEVSLTYVVTAGLIATLGWIDDRRSLSAKARLILQFLLAGILLLASGIPTTIQIPLVGVATLGIGIGFFVSVVWIVGLTNAYNFMDGIDGLAGTQAVCAGTAWCFLLLIERQATLALLAGLVEAASLGFLVLNAPPALIFMGDVGSTFLGFTLAAIPVLVYHQTQNPRLLITGVLLVAPFVFDSTLTIVRRALKRENILKPHRSHLYQRLVKMNYSHRQVTGLYMGLCLISALCGWLYYAGSDQLALLAVLGVAALCTGLAVGVNRIELNDHQL